jgi:hypothetical protein
VGVSMVHGCPWLSMAVDDDDDDDDDDDISFVPFDSTL